MYKERISVFKVLSNVFSMGAANIIKFVVAMVIPALAFLLMSFCSGLIIGSAAIMSEHSAGEILLCAIITLVVTFGVCIPLSIGIYCISRNYQDKHEIIFSDIFVCFKENIMLKSIGLTFLLGLILVVGYILFIIPGIILTYMFIFAFFVMIDNTDLGILEIISLTAKLTKGYKLKIFGYNIILGIIPGILYMVLRGSTLGCIIYFIISLIVSAVNLLGLSFFYMDSLDWFNNATKE
ncbi:hypothetical protein ACJDT4_03535 [Clostridium neuense]|uniref:DUF975 family protein n=1 Tax=Clostridium neuense TaxID=1728934 RepID=A0ABW8TB89_9CLOT